MSIHLGGFFDCDFTHRVYNLKRPIFCSIRKNFNIIFLYNNTNKFFKNLKFKYFKKKYVQIILFFKMA